MYLDRLRYDDLSVYEFELTLMKYHQSLSKMPFGNRSVLLKYFGHSFFHDATMLSMTIIPYKKTIIMDFTSDNILEDINTYRIKNGLVEIDQRAYNNNPVIFNIKFSKVLGFRTDIETFDGMFIMDTEITGYDQSRGYEVTIHLNEGKYMSFCCKGAQVTIDRDLISNYTNGLGRIPFCKVCQARLLTKERFTSFIRERYEE